MKRFCVLIAGTTLMVGLALASTAGAGNGDGSQKVNWYTVVGGSSDNVTTTTVPGHVDLNAPNGAVALIVNGVITLDPNTTYDVWVRDLAGYSGAFLYQYAPLGYIRLATFTTDGDGNGAFHLNLRSADLPSGTYGIQVAINTDS